MNRLDDYSDFCEYLHNEDVEDVNEVTLSVEYTNAEGETNQFRITDIRRSSEYGEKYLCAYCVDKDGETEDKYRTFKIERFEWISVCDVDEDDDDDFDY